ncbi:UNVERIFIED_CONTAM: protein SCAI [Sesamum radiatum]|uniref:Protein SCAI n=1 Tax=Sesamum radiatum TaxID=300843 RepID=A0AAW2P3H7_SESRA
MSKEELVPKTFRALVESAERKFARVRDAPLHPYGGSGPQYGHFYHKVFKAYMRLWKYQQENRAKLMESGLQRWEIGEIASRIGQLYFNQYLRTSEARFLLEAYIFYEAIFHRKYFEGSAKDRGVRFKELRFYARFLMVSLILNRTEMVKLLVEKFKEVVDDSKVNFRETNFKEWKLVVQEIVRFTKADPAFINARPLRYTAMFDSYPASLPYVARFHAKRLLKFRDALLTSYRKNEVIATVCEELPPDSVMLIYLSTSGPNILFPGDIIPFTRRPLFLIIDSDNSHAFKAAFKLSLVILIVPANLVERLIVLHGAERGEPAALFLSPLRPSFKNPSGVDVAQHGSQFTFFLAAPLQAFCQLVDHNFTSDDMDIYDTTESIIATAFSKWEEILCTSTDLDLVWAQLLCDPFLRRLILRFIFCRAVLTLFSLREKGDRYLPVCIPELPNSVAVYSKAVQPAISQLASHLKFFLVDLECGLEVGTLRYALLK